MTGQTRKRRYWGGGGGLTPEAASGCTRSKRLQFGAQAPVTWAELFDFGCPDTRLRNRVIFFGIAGSNSRWSASK